MTIDKVQSGLARYIDEEIINNMPGWRKWVFGGASTLLIASLPENMKRWQQTELGKMLGVFDGDDINMGKVYQAVKRHSVKGPISFEIPGAGSLTLHDADVDKIWQYMQG